MLFSGRSLAILLTLVTALAAGRTADAVILSRTATRNTAAPTGALANSGWQFQGKWGSFPGTPISPNHFITAGHVGGWVGQSFNFGGVNYKTTATYDDPRSDLRIWRVGGAFPRWAPLYTNQWETGKRAALFGRGTQRGAGVTVNGQVKGWKPGYADYVPSWGENQIHSAFNAGPGLGSLLRYRFDRNGLANEGTLSGGDSGGGLFINESGVWKLAGVHYGIDSPWSLTGRYGSGFDAAVLDAGGLYIGGDDAWRKIYDGSADVAASAYSSRISTNLPWIRSVIGNPRVSTTSRPLSSGGPAAVPEPAALTVLALAAALLTRRRAG